MGFDYRKIPTLSHASYCKKYKIANFFHDDVLCIINDKDNKQIDDIPNEIIKHFKAANGWIGHIEL